VSLDFSIVGKSRAVGNGPVTPLTHFPRVVAALSHFGSFHSRKDACSVFIHRWTTRKNVYQLHVLIEIPNYGRDDRRKAVLPPFFASPLPGGAASVGSLSPWGNPPKRRSKAVGRQVGTGCFPCGRRHWGWPQWEGFSCFRKIARTSWDLSRTLQHAALVRSDSPQSVDNLCASCPRKVGTIGDTVVLGRNSARAGALQPGQAG
jgi:hypothetical protein